MTTEAIDQAEGHRSSINLVRTVGPPRAAKWVLTLFLILRASYSEILTQYVEEDTGPTTQM